MCVCVCMFLVFPREEKVTYVTFPLAFFSFTCDSKVIRVSTRMRLFVVVFLSVVFLLTRNSTC